MKKVFFYLYPIKEYTKMFTYNDDILYDKQNTSKPLLILNECIQKRYRDNGYQVVFALYPDRDIFGIIPNKEDKIIYTDITFEEASAYDKNGKKKKEFKPKYPNEQSLIKQLGNIDELVVGGYHAQDCVKKVGETALNMGINTIVDLDMTDLFFGLYKQVDYFKIEEYNPQKYKEYFYQKASWYGEEFAERQFNRNYSSPVYGFNKDKDRTRK